MKLARGVRAVVRRVIAGAPPPPLPPEARLGSEPVPPPDERERAFWLDCLRRAYPDAEIADEGAREPLTPAQLLDSDAPLDMFRWRYPLAAEPLTAPLTDPGRVRAARLFDRLYGDCARNEVKPRLAQVRWADGSTISMTTVGGVTAAFDRAARRIEADPALTAICRDPGKGYHCRAIAGTTRRSMHSYGAAFDLDPERTHYWQWEDAREGRLASYINTVPIELVAAFESEGFIWGGRWAHFDTMHFEYRPELILAAKG